MNRVRCYECGKHYDYDEDCFCSHCGAFNQPRRSRRISADGTVVRVDGLNENNHENSFVHRELHTENRKRKGTDLEQPVKPQQRPAQPKIRTAAPQRMPERKAAKKPGAIVGFVVFMIFIEVLGALTGLLD